MFHFTDRSPDTCMYVTIYMQANTAAVRNMAKEELKSGIPKKMQENGKTPRRNEQEVSNLWLGFIISFF